MTIVEELQPVSPADRDRILAAPRTSEAHRSILASLPAMNAVQCGGQARARELPAAFRVLAWNLERCLFPEDSAAHLSDIAPQILLLSEMDHGMARTKQRHTAADMAQALGMVYAFGVEFFEMDLGGETERPFCDDAFNALGWHGNAILSAVPFDRVAMFRLDDHGHWFTPDAGGDAGQPRVGGRNAIAAVVPTGQGPICVVSTHLESNADSPHRARQFDLLMAQVDAFAPGLPVVIGGDLNTGNHMPPDFDWRGEVLFANAEARGYDWSFTADGMTTRPSLITRHPSRKMKLDWICGRGVTCTSTGILPALDADDRPLSDHDAVHAGIKLTG
ncbi:endonuclease/exonuclease/phosphatase family protein [Jannaschia sp. 2305UL9-9]|uniref:endonuclease/exonuclease/phosphatase family protein n=1 Tax=Jannaschia sp. 2305UL9-9 TaxID=3121638 RepID=UPI00352757D2